MTPTLFGRWQTRLLLLSTVGLAVTLLFGHFVTAPNYTTPLFLLGYVILFGFLWDVLFRYLQSFRWDHDWPPVFQLLAGIVEGAFLWGMVQATPFWMMLNLDHIPGVSPQLHFDTFSVHYATVWFFTFLATQGPLRIIFPRWRYHGGEWI